MIINDISASFLRNTYVLFDNVLAVWCNDSISHGTLKDPARVAHIINYASNLHFVVLCFVWLIVEFTHI